jgi:predicted MFS family arabinose efflux permease
LIAEIDALDRWRDRVGWRIIYLFLGVFAFAVGLLIYTAMEGQPRTTRAEHPGPRVPGVLRPAR